MRFGLAVAAVAAVTTLGAADTSWFSDSFEGIAEGAELCDTGAVGGTWGETPVPEGASAVRVTDGETAAIALRSEPKRGVTFDADAAAGTDAAWAVDLRLRFESVYDCEGDTLDAPLAFTLGYDDDDAISFAGWVGDTWHYLTRFALGGAAEATSNVWYDVRIETRTIAGTRYAGFSVLGGGVDRTFTLNLPRRRVGTKADSCLALVAYQSDGKTVVARNYRLVRRKESGFAVIVKQGGI